MLCHLRLANCTEGDIELLKSREVRNGDIYPIDALHVFKKNVDVTEHNLHELAPTTDHIIIPAIDDTKGQTTSCTGGLPTTLTIAKGAKVMLTVNVDVSDGLVNGARGIVASVMQQSERVTLSTCMIPT